MKRLYLLKVKIMDDDGDARPAYALGATEHTLNTGSPVRADAFELFSLSGNKIEEVFGSPVPLDHVGTFTDDDGFSDLVEGINAEPTEPGRDIDDEGAA